MFYSSTALTKKGPLSKIWLAAHFSDKKLTRSSLDDTDLVLAVSSLSEHTVRVRNDSESGQVSENTNGQKNGRMAFSLRLSGQLLLGICRIYARKVKFLQEDAVEVQNRIAQSMKVVMSVGNKLVDLQPQGGVPNLNRAENWEDLDFVNMELDLETLHVPNMDELDVQLGDVQMEELDKLVEEKVAKKARQSATPMALEMGRASYENEDHLEAIPLEYLSQTPKKGIPLVIPFSEGKEIEKTPLLDVEMGRRSDIDNLHVQSGAYYDLPDMDYIPPNVDVLPDALNVSEVQDVQESVALKAKAPREVKRVRKTKLVIDEKTQLSEHDLRARQSSHDEVVVDIRPTVPLNKKARFLNYRSSDNYVDYLLANPSTYMLTRLSPELFSVFKPMFHVGVPDLPLVGAEVEPVNEKEALSSIHESRKSVRTSQIDDMVEQTGAYYDMPDMDIPNFEAQPAQEVVPFAVPHSPFPVGEDAKEDFLPQLSVEEVEEKVEIDEQGWTKRSRMMYSTLQKNGLGKSKKMSTFIEGGRSNAAAVFYEILLLKTRDYIDVKQSEPFAEIMISQGPKFNQ